MSCWPARDAAHLLVESAPMAALEERLFASGLPVEALMEKAALAISRALLARPELLRDGVLVLAGPGHNGGDALVVARELHLAGVAVRIWSPFERHKPLTEAHLRHAAWLGIERLAAPPDPAAAELWVDGLFGIGQHRPPEPRIATLLEQRQRLMGGRLVAIDVPTGLCANSGRPLGPVAACAAITYCLGLLKQGLVQDTALAWVGQLERLDLGLPAALLADLPADQPLALLGSDRATAPWPQRPLAAGKYARGRLLVVSGSAAYPGAGQLSLLGASASGCGSLRAALPRALAEQIWLVQPYVVISAALEERAGGGLALADLAIPGLLERLDAVLVGPGIGGDRESDRGADSDGGTWGNNGGSGGSGAGSEADQRLEHGSAATAGGEEQGWEALRRFSGLVVIDADGLNRLAAGAAGAPEPWLRGRAGATWLTPHQGEFARLFPDLASETPLRAAATAAQRCGVSLALKGARTVVAAADGRRWQVLHAAAAAARAGLGDVLAGYAAGQGACAGAGDGELLAAAVLDHAEAGLTCARQRGAGQTTPQAVAATLGSAWDRPLESGER